MTDELVPELLRGIRSDIRDLGDRLSERIDATNARVDHLAEQMVRGFTSVNDRISETNERLDQAVGRLDQTNERLTRVEGHLHALHGAHVERWADIERRVTRVEAHVGLD